MKYILKHPAFVDHKLSDEEYHDTWADKDGNPLYSSSEVKGLLKGEPAGVRPQTKSMELGSVVHKYLQSVILGEDYHILPPPNHPETGKPLAKNTIKYKELLPDIDKKYPKGNYIVLNNTEYTEHTRSLLGVKDYLVTVLFGDGEIKLEESIFISKKRLDESSTRLSSSILKNLRVTLLLALKCGIKAKPDMVSLQKDSIQIYDFKTTTKTSIDEIKRQARTLEYEYSMLHYALALEIFYERPVTEYNLIYLTKKLDCGPFIMRRKTTEDVSQFFQTTRNDEVEKRLKKGLDMQKDLEKNSFVTIDLN